MYYIISEDKRQLRTPGVFSFFHHHEVFNHDGTSRAPDNGTGQLGFEFCVGRFARTVQEDQPLQIELLEKTSRTFNFLVRRATVDPQSG